MEFYYEDYQQSDEFFVATMNRALEDCNVMIVFLGERLSTYQSDEISTAYRIYQKQQRHFFVVLLAGQEELPPKINFLGNYIIIKVDDLNSSSAYDVAKKIVNDFLKRPWLSDDDLPLNPIYSIMKKILSSILLEKIKLKVISVHCKTNGGYRQHRRRNYR